MEETKNVHPKKNSANIFLKKICMQRKKEKKLDLGRGRRWWRVAAPPAAPAGATAPRAAGPAAPVQIWRPCSPSLSPTRALLRESQATRERSCSPSPSPRPNQVPVAALHTRLPSPPAAGSASSFSSSVAATPHGRCCCFCRSTPSPEE